MQNTNVVKHCVFIINLFIMWDVFGRVCGGGM